MANNSGEDYSEGEASFLLIDINKPIDLKYELFTTKEKEASTLKDKCSLDPFEDKVSVEVVSQTANCIFQIERGLLGKIIRVSEQHRLNSGKIPQSAIIKTLDKGRKLKCERCLSADSIYTKWDIKYFCVKFECKPSMKRGEF